jgi:hypothetical protein
MGPVIGFDWARARDARVSAETPGDSLPGVLAAGGWYVTKVDHGRAEDGERERIDHYKAAAVKYRDTLVAAFNSILADLLDADGMRALVSAAAAAVGDAGRRDLRWMAVVTNDAVGPVTAAMWVAVEVVRRLKEAVALLTGDATHAEAELSNISLRALMTFRSPFGTGPGLDDVPNPILAYAAAVGPVRLGEAVKALGELLTPYPVAGG